MQDAYLEVQKIQHKGGGTVCCPGRKLLRILQGMHSIKASFLEKIFLEIVVLSIQKVRMSPIQPERQSLRTGLESLHCYPGMLKRLSQIKHLRAFWNASTMDTLV